MSSHVFVVDTSFKRTQIKVTPGKSLREVLEEACKSRKLSPDGYTLKTQNNKAIDLSQPFRLSGLSPGAKLQLTQASKSPGVVSVALQLPESEGSGRLSDKFLSTTSLWLVLRKFEDAVAGGPPTKLNLTQRGVPSSSTGAGRLMYEQPCLHVVGRNFETFTDLQKTLGQLGLNSGSALLRLNYKSGEQPLEEAMAEISNYFGAAGTQTTDAPTSSGQAAESSAVGGSGTDAVVADEPIPAGTAVDNGGAAQPQQHVTDDIEMEDDSAALPVEADRVSHSAETAIQQVPPSETAGALNGISVYRPPTSNTPAAALEPDDPSVFEPTVDHAKAHQAALNRAGKNQRLLSDKELAEQESQRQQSLATVRNVIVRVRYPDQSQIETNISATDTATDIYTRIADTLAASPEEPFELRYTAMTGAKARHETLPRSGVRLVRDCGFRGKVMLTLVWSPEASLKARQPPSLKEEYRRQAMDLKVELATAQAAYEDSAGSQKAGPSKEDKSSSSGTGKKLDAEARMKRFLGLGKK